MGDKSQGLYRKYNVTRTDGSSDAGGKHHGCQYFVLDLDHDPHARAALAAYKQSCQYEYPLLASDIRALLYGCAFGGTPTAELGATPETSVARCSCDDFPGADEFCVAHKSKEMCSSLCHPDEPCSITEDGKCEAKKAEPALCGHDDGSWCDESCKEKERKYREYHGLPKKNR